MAKYDQYPKNDYSISQLFINIMNQTGMQRLSKPRRVHEIQDKNSKKQQYNLNTNPDILYTDDEIGLDSQECRICLEGQFTDAENSNRLISPCRCTGSVQYIHQSCIRQWIQKSRQKKIDPIKCELCKQQIMYQLIARRECNKWQSIKFKITINYKIFLFLFFLLLINCGVTIYLIVIFAHIIQQSAEQPKFIQIGVLAFSIILLLVISSVLVSIILKQFFYTNAKRIGEVYSYRVRKLTKNGSIERKLEFSKAQIFPSYNFAQIQQIE